MNEEDLDELEEGEGVDVGEDVGEGAGEDVDVAALRLKDQPVLQLLQMPAESFALTLQYQVPGLSLGV